MKIRFISLISGMLLLASAAFGQGYRYDNIALLDTGRPANSASIRVCSSGSTGTPCTPAASIFSDSGLSVAITGGIFTSDTLGNYGFYAACNKYDVQISGSGLTTRTMKDVQIGPCSSAGTGTISASLLTAKQDVDGCFTVGGVNGAANVQAAITLAGTTGCVVVPTTYAGTDTYTNPNGIPVLDHRPIAINGVPNAALMFGSNFIFLNSLIRTGPSQDALNRTIPDGNDMFLDVKGAADFITEQEVEKTTSTTSAVAGTQNITVGTTSHFYLGAAIDVDRWGANEELINTGSWSIVNGTTLNATFTKSHTQPYTVDQWGANQIKGVLNQWFDSDTGALLAQLIQQRLSPSGAKGFAFADSNNDFLYQLKAVDQVPRIYGKAGTGLNLYGSWGATGTNGVLSFRNNQQDETELFQVDATGKIAKYSQIPTVSNGVPSEVATVDLVAQTAALGTTTLYAVPATGAGQYRLSWDSKLTTAAATSSTLGSMIVNYVDPDGVTVSTNLGAQVSAGLINTTATTNNTQTILVGVPFLINAKASTNITFSFGYASVPANTMAYNLHIKLEAL